MYTVLEMADGVQIIVTPDGYECPAMPSFAELLMIVYPPGMSHRITCERLTRNYGWRVKEAVKAIETDKERAAGVGV